MTNAVHPEGQFHSVGCTGDLNRFVKPGRMGRCCEMLITAAVGYVSLNNVSAVSAFCRMPFLGGASTRPGLPDTIAFALRNVFPC